MTDTAVDAAQRGDVVWMRDHSPLRRAKSTGGRVIYAIGDVHGCYEQLVALLEAIVADIARSDGATPASVIFCGDYVDRGPDSAKVLDALVWLRRQAPFDVAFLRGNHEAMLLQFLERPDQALLWLEHDGIGTLASYGVEAGPEEDCYQLRDRLLDAMPAAHLELLRALPVRLVRGDYVFVHAGLRPGVALARQSDEDCLWIGDDFLRRDRRFEKIVVHGHSWRTDRPEVTDHRIGIDTGVYATGVLTAVRLDGAQIAFVQARRTPDGAVEMAADRH